jgi:hypothetical protein
MNIPWDEFFGTLLSYLKLLLSWFSQLAIHVGEHWGMWGQVILYILVVIIGFWTIYQLFRVAVFIMFRIILPLAIISLTLLFLVVLTS